LKKPKSEAISEILAKELSLTEEEILLLQTSEPSNLLLPRLLFIFDRYDDIQDIHNLSSSKTYSDYESNNFYMSNKIETLWKNAKIIITCREENLKDVTRRDLLFAPINVEATELLSFQGSFLQRKIEPFSDDQITCYLKKYCYSRQIDRFEGRKIKSSVSSSSLLRVLTPRSPSSSWSWVIKFEKMLDNYNLKEHARIPFMLWVIVEVLASIANEEIDQRYITPALINEMESKKDLNYDKIKEEEDIGAEKGPESYKLKILSRRFLIDSFVNQIIKSVAQKNVAASKIPENKGGAKQKQEEIVVVESLAERIKQQVQNLALRLSNYSINTATDAATNMHDDDSSLLELYPLIKECDGSLPQFSFNYPFLQEFFIAKKIEEELIEFTKSSHKGKSMKVPTEFLLNQRLLNRGASSNMIILFLRDAVRDERIAADQFVSLILLSQQKEEDNSQSVLRIIEQKELKSDFEGISGAFR